MWKDGHIYRSGVRPMNRTFARLVTDHDIEIMFATIGCDDEDQWHAVRRTRGMSSEAVAIMDESSFKSAWDVWRYKKTGEQSEIPNQDELDWNRDREDQIFDYFLRNCDEVSRLEDGVRTQDYEVQLSRTDKRLGATCDGFVVINGKLVVVEIKCAGEYSRKWWENGVPDYVYWQVQHQLLVTGLDDAYVVVSIGGRAPVWYHLTRQQADIDVLVDEWHEFWNVYDRGEEPDVGWATNPKDIVTDEEEPADADLEFELLYQELLEAKEKKASLERNYSEAKNKLIKAASSRKMRLRDVTITIVVRENGAVHIYERKNDK